MKTIEEVEKALQDVRLQIKERKYYVGNAQMRTLKKLRQTLICKLIYMRSKENGNKAD